MIYRLAFRVSDGIYYDGKKTERVLEAGGSCTLEKVCRELLDSMDFDFDHLYSFSVNGKIYEGNPYEKSCRCAKTKLEALNLKKGDKFLLEYDYGDSWIFKVTVQDVAEGTGKNITLVSSTGNQEQYPDLDEESYDWDDEDLDMEDREGGDPDDDFEEVVWDYRAPDELYEAAFAYKKTKLWKKLTGEDNFILQYSDGTMGYISIMGNAGDHLAVAVYPGEDGLRSLREVALRPAALMFIPTYERVTRQNCLQLIFDNKEYVREEDIESAKAYADAHGIRFSGKNAYPHFLKLFPDHMPWHPVSEQEHQYLLETIRTAIYVSDLLKNKKPEDLGFIEIYPGLRELPYFIYKDRGPEYAGKAELPEEKPFDWPVPSSINEVSAAKIRKWKARECLQCCVIQTPAPVLHIKEDSEDRQPINIVDDERKQNANAEFNEEEIPYYPFALFAASKKSGMIYQPAMCEKYYSEPEQIANEFLEIMVREQIRPKTLEAKDERTYALLKPVAEAISAELILDPCIPVFDQLIEEMPLIMEGRSFESIEDLLDDEDLEELEDSRTMGGCSSPEDEYSQLLEMVEMFLEMLKSSVRMMPADIRETFEDLSQAGVLPRELERKLKNKLKQ